MALNLPHLDDIQQLSNSPRIVRILGGNPGKFTLQGTNTYLIGPAHALTLIDTGQGEAQWLSSLSAHLSTTSSAKITDTLLTHWHPDHVGGLPQLLSHPAASATSIHKNDPKYLGYGEVASRLDSLTAEGKLKKEAWIDIADGQDFSVGDGWRLRTLHTPGHTTDHMCFLLLNAAGTLKGLFTGDNVLGHGTAVFEDLGTYMRTLEVMRAALGEGEDKVPLYPGHGAVVEDGRGKLSEYIEHRAMRERQILDVLSGKRGTSERQKRKGFTSMEIVKVVYGDVPESLHIPAEGGVRQVLRKLEEEGRVVCEEDLGDKRWKLSGSAESSL